MTASLSGVLVALATPFTPDGSLDESRLRALVDRTIDGGVHGVVACGSTGEFSALSGDERRRVVETVVDQTAATIAAERLSHLDGLNDVTHEGRVVRARTRSAAGVIPSVLASLDQAGVEVESATVSRPSLDDVYLHYAGRTFEVEEGADR